MAFHNYDPDDVQAVGKSANIIVPPSSRTMQQKDPAVVDILRYNDNLEKIYAYLSKQIEKLAWALYNDVVVAFNNKTVMTATQAQFVQAQKISRMEPIIHNLQKSLIEPILDSIAYCCAEQLPQPPEGVVFQDNYQKGIALELKGTFANSIKRKQLNSLSELYNIAIQRGQAMQASPDMMRVLIDPIAESTFLADSLHLDPSIFRSASEQQKFIELMQQAQQVQQEQQTNTKK